jgi:C_GCAxxG_C_C family probable redox protein
MSERAKQAEADFAQGFSCSQAVLAAFGPALGLDRSTSLKISQPFGGGTAQQGETCGAVAGAYLVIGLKHGRDKAEDAAARDLTYAKMREFMQRFTDLHGALECRRLLGYRLDDPDEHARAEQAGLFQDLCPRFVRSAVEILEDLLPSLS